MRARIGLVAAVLVPAVIAATLAAQAPAPAQPAPSTQKPQTPLPAGRGGQGRGATFPAQQRAPGDPAVVAKGKTLYEINCRACHGADLRGGDIGGPNLLRSHVVLNDQHGELIIPVVRQGRMNPGMPVMPPMPLPEDDIKAIAEYIHAVAATMRGQGAPPPGEEVPLNIVVGDATAGRAYFESRCASCHSATGDLQGIASRHAEPVQLQNAWVSGGAAFGRGGGRGGPAPPSSASARRRITVSVTPPTGPPVEGRLDRIDDFVVVLTTEDGYQRSFTRRADVKVEVKDPLEPHRKLLTEYTDKDIHDVTAYLVTLK